MNPLRILYQDSDIVAIHKPAGFFVHRPENALIPFKRHELCLQILRDQLGQEVFPLHRLDKPTQGVLLFALSSTVASQIAKQFSEGLTKKTYWAVVRGFVDEEGFIDIPLAQDNSDREVPAQTKFKLIKHLEIKKPVGPYSTARYSWVEAYPLTGRFHQIRRHFRHLSHPVVGDTIYGDGKHNRFFKGELGIPGLLLRSVSLGFFHPILKKQMSIKSVKAKNWGLIQDLFGYCPIL